VGAQDLCAALFVVTSLFGGGCGSESDDASDGATQLDADASPWEFDCAFATIDVAPFEGPAIERTEYECSPDSDAFWQCMTGGPDSLIFVSTACTTSENERAVLFRYTTEAPQAVVVRIASSDDGTPLSAGLSFENTMVGGNPAPAPVLVGGSIMIEGDVMLPEQECVSGRLSYSTETFALDGTFRTQACTY